MAGLTVGALVLAAGASRRFGPEAKLMADLAGLPLMAHALRPYGAAGLPVRMLVTAPDAASQRAIGEEMGWRVTINPGAEDGMGTSLAWGMGALLNDPSLPQLDALFVGLADMPLLSAPLLSGLAHALAARRADWDLVAPVQDGRRGHPVLFSKACFEALTECRGDEGARRIISAAGERAGTWPCEDPAIHMDVDTPDDLATIRARSRAS